MSYADITKELNRLQAIRRRIVVCRRNQSWLTPSEKKQLVMVRDEITRLESEKKELH